MRVDFYRHDLRPSDAERVAKVLATPFLTTGQVSRGVEGQLRQYFGVPHACLVNSWTNGALAVLLAMELQPEDEVIVPAMTFIASANVVELAGAKVVFADVEPDSLLLTPEIVAKHVTERTRAVMPVHIYGQLCDVEGIRRTIDHHPKRSGQVRIIEDAAHCFEGEYRGDKPGRFGDVTASARRPTCQTSWRPCCLPRSMAIFSFYAFGNGPLRLVREVPETKSAEHIFTIGVPNGKRDEAIAALNAAGIHVAVNFRSVPGTRYYTQKYPQALGECPNAGLWGSQTLTLPMYPSLTREEQDYVIKVVREQVYPLAGPSS